jgi:hypothetical protein
MKMRHIFSQVENFELYDFIDKHGNVNENILAFSNRAGDENALVIYNNSYETYEGTIKYSNLKVTNGNVQSSKYITEVLNIRNDLHHFYIYNDHRTELQFLISGKVINDEGFKTKLFGYQYRICLNFREVYDAYGNYEKLYHHLNGRGVTSIEEAIVELDLIPLHSALEELLAPPNIRKIRNYIFQSSGEEKIKQRKKKEKKKKKVKKQKEPTVSTSITDGMGVLIKEIKYFNERDINKERIEKSLKNNLTSAREFYQLWGRYTYRKNVPKWMSEADRFIPLHPDDKNNIAICVYSTLIMFDLILTNGSHEILHNYNSLILSKPLVKIFNHHTEEDVSLKNVQLITSLINFNNELKKKKVNVKWNKTQKVKTVSEKQVMLNKLPFSSLLHDKYVSSFLNVNNFEDITYFSKERFVELAHWLNELTILKLFTSYEKALDKLRSTKKKSKKGINKQGLERILLGEIKKSYVTTKDIVQNAENTGYDLNKFINSISKVKMKSSTKR